MKGDTKPFQDETSFLPLFFFIPLQKGSGHLETGGRCFLENPISIHVIAKPVRKLAVAIRSLKPASQYHAENSAVDAGCVPHSG